MANILVCDDERSICEMLDIALRREGHKIETVNSGEAAKRKIDGALYDLIITDIKMPNIDGIEVLRHHAYRTVGEFLSGGAVGPDSSSVKLLMAEAEQRLAATALELLGPSLLRGDAAEAAEDQFWQETYLYSRAASVYGGTRQLQRNIIADRVLTLPQS